MIEALVVFASELVVAILAYRWARAVWRRKADELLRAHGTDLESELRAEELRKGSYGKGGF